MREREMKTVLQREELLHDISNLAYVIADVSEGKESPHTLHQTFDICEEGNTERVERLLGLAAAEIGSEMGKGISIRHRRKNYVLTFCGVTEKTVAKVTELAREYMVASVLHGWLSVTLPAAATFWANRRDETLSSLRSAATPPTGGFTRRVSPI
ncbi:MAG: hypothetical protein HDR88_14145 [Bacteroides sp.]|nr:hypothetical protein [Bacteroides sp.]